MAWMLHSNDTPEMRLWRAVAYRAVQDCFNADPSIMSNAWWWIYRDKSKGFNSFESICTMCDCNPETIKITVAQEFLRRYQDPFAQHGFRARVINTCHRKIMREYKAEIQKYSRGNI